MNHSIYHNIHSNNDIINSNNTNERLRLGVPRLRHRLARQGGVVDLGPGRPVMAVVVIIIIIIIIIVIIIVAIIIVIVIVIIIIIIVVVVVVTIVIVIICSSSDVIR